MDFPFIIYTKVNIIEKSNEMWFNPVCTHMVERSRLTLYTVVYPDIFHPGGIHYPVSTYPPLDV